MKSLILIYNASTLCTIQINGISYKCTWNVIHINEISYKCIWNIIQINEIAYKCIWNVIQINEIINSFLKGIPTLLLIIEKGNSTYYKINKNFSFESKNTIT